ncbi:hypothetical protein KY290_000534 [Solanum tuberosum]|uniref:Uncharacterized protein n=1 Tax=Solanum tuberosum TaxID=4113 RepID=A0ABQ7WJK4_SOLTU|nr:hypothetical protein KY289_000590 [Solanum tuberosum]KAH0780936.1 hypothetical protein KY290_000534 [Solanum tuberosum]
MAAVPVALSIFHLWPLLPPPKRRRRNYKPIPSGSSRAHCGGTGQSRLGGGFRSYGYDRQGGRGSSDDFHRQEGFRRYTDREIAPSSANETDDCGAAKKTSAAFVPSSGRRFDRRGSFESNDSDSDSDRWTKRKEEEGGRRFASGGGAFNSLRERRGGLLGLWGGLWVYGLKEWSNG